MVLIVIAIYYKRIKRPKTLMVIVRCFHAQLTGNQQDFTSQFYFNISEAVGDPLTGALNNSL